MPRVDLAYGRTGLSVELGANADIIEPRYLPGLPDEAGALRHALEHPTTGPALRDIVEQGASVGISVCDVTRPFPGRRVLPILLEQLRSVDAGPITLFIATGTHRVCTAEELDQMFGPEIQQHCEVVQHNAFDIGRHRQVGTVLDTGTPALVEAAF